MTWCYRIIIYEFIQQGTTHKEGKSIFAKRLIKTLKNKIYKYITSISKNMFIDKLDDIASKYSSTYGRTIKMKPGDVNSSTFIGIKKENNKKDLKFEVDDHVNISKYKNIFAKGYVPNWSKEVFVVKKVKNTVPWKYVTSNLNDEEMVGTFYEKELKEQIKIVFNSC